MTMQHDKGFKLDAVQYYPDYENLGVRGYAENLGIGYSILSKWLFKEYEDFLFCIILTSLKYICYTHCKICTRRGYVMAL